MARHPTNRRASYKIAAGAQPPASVDGAVGSPVTATRVCIKNIPPSFTSTHLRDYLLKEFQVRSQQSQQSQQRLVITDCHVLMDVKKKQSRRIAFVGLQTPQMAQVVIHLFHRTFALTSRLSVEPAHGTSQQHDHKQKQQQQQQPVNKEQKSTKIHNEQNADHRDDDKNKTASALEKEALPSMPPQKAKFWSNDFDNDAFGEQPPRDVPPSTYANEQNVDHGDPLGRRQNADNEKDNGADSKSSASDDASSSDDDNGEDYADPLANKMTRISDLEFLRSKQTRAEDLPEEMPPTNDTENLLHDDVAHNKGGDSREDSSSQSSDDSSGQDPAIEETINPADRISKHDMLHETKDKSGAHEQQDDEDKSDNDDTQQVASNRLFVRNLPFATTEEELQEHFASFGNIEECHIPVDDRKLSKGFGFVSFEKRQDAIRALEELDGKDFQGRFLHIVPSRKPPQSTTDHDENLIHRPLSYKERQELSRQQAAAKSDKGWSASFVRGDAVVDSLADRLGIKKGDIFNVKDGLSSGDAAVRLALGETQVIEENREYFHKHGIDMETLVPAQRGAGEVPTTSASSKRSTTSILVKNLPYDTLLEELSKIFHQVGDAPVRILLPPSRTIALVEYGHASDAKRAFRRLAYKRFKNVPLYLEWAPLAALVELPAGIGASEPSKATEAQSSTGLPNEIADAPASGQYEGEDDEKAVLDGSTPTLYIKNLNFSTTEESLRQFLEKHAKDIRAVNIPKKAAPIRKHSRSNGAAGQADNDAGEVQALSMGYGFVEFASQESARMVLKKLHGIFLDGHKLEVKPSTKALVSKTVKPPSTKKNPTKVAVRNVPFQATRTELLKLFGSFGQLKRVRVPKKFDGGHRGFAFVEFVTHKEALAAMKALSRTHLYGRHLVLEWAEEDENDPASDSAIAGLRKKAQRDVSSLDNTGQSKRHRVE